MENSSSTAICSVYLCLGGRYHKYQWLHDRHTDDLVAISCDGPTSRASGRRVERGRKSRWTASKVGTSKDEGLGARTLVLARRRPYKRGAVLSTSGRVIPRMRQGRTVSDSHRNQVHAKSGQTSQAHRIAPYKRPWIVHGVS